MLAKQYADALSDRLPADVFRPLPRRVWWLLLHGMLVTVCTIAIVDGRLGWLAKLGLAVVLGVSFSCMGIVGHEVLHGSIFERLWARRFVAAVCLAPLALGPVFWTIWHNIHHAHTQDPAKDPDNWGTSDRAPIDP